MEYVKCSGDRMIIQLGSNLNSKIGAAIVNEAKSLISPEIKGLDVYCGSLTHTSEEGICALRRIKWKADVDMILHNVSGPVKDIFSLTLMDGYFIFEDE